MQFDDQTSASHQRPQNGGSVQQGGQQPQSTMHITSHYSNHSRLQRPPCPTDDTHAILGPRHAIVYCPASKNFLEILVVDHIRMITILTFSLY
ncbi:hypothetical protein GOP47_0014127 [Adiantum capillus-veneris]|uniref:Uncharacterized protein n=1 Tax=Adiantum capillus-veneris TaxID=13818 RepID=A0A9D4ZGF7_ADICA|nr:hypothetical protein GOP47_0014127 [Adiantum capillus-veneris]